MSRKKKRPEEKAKARNLTFQPGLWEMAEKKAAAQKYSSVSAYLTALVMRDCNVNSGDGDEVETVLSRILAEGISRVQKKTP